MGAPEKDHFRTGLDPGSESLGNLSSTADENCELKAINVTVKEEIGILSNCFILIFIENVIRELLQLDIHLPFQFWRHLSRPSSGQNVNW